jgi:hypothetical protein
MNNLWLIGMSLGMIWLTMRLLPRRWKESRPPPQKTACELPTETPSSSFWRGLRYGGYMHVQGRRELLDKAPFQWLTSKNRLPALIGSVGSWCMLLILAALLWALGMQFNWMDREAIMLGIVGIVIGMHLFAKCLLGIQASRQLSEDRETGALELLLTTPLRARDIWRGQQKAILRQARFPMAAATLMNLVLFYFAVLGDGFLIRDTAARWSLGILLGGGLVILWLDSLALIWLGMHQGMRKPPHKAAVFTLGRILGLPWLALGLFVLTSTSGFNNGIREALVEGAIFIWLVLNLLWSGIAFQMSRDHLKAHFRLLAAGDIPDPATLYDNPDNEDDTLQEEPGLQVESVETARARCG